MAGRNGHLVPRSLPQLHEGRRVTKKLFPGGSQRRSCLIAHEERASKLLLEHFDAGTDGRLAHIEALRGADEAAGRYDFQEGSGEFRVHAS